MKVYCFFMTIIASNIFFDTFLCMDSSDNKNNKVESILSSNGLLKNVLRHSPKISEQEIHETELNIVKKAHEEENKMIEKVGKCIKDYTSLCPSKWKKGILKDGKSICTANSEYNGFCDTIQSFEYFTENDKMNFETSCNVEWPCKNSSKEICEEGTRDYNEPCPEGFLIQDDSSCKADITVYRGMCNGESINFTHMSNEQKETWSVACEAYWPCYKKCSSEEYISNCPKNWIEINPFECLPKDSYKGPCKNKTNFKYFTEPMKKEFEEKCKTRFVCNNTCEKDYEQNCPLNWKEEKGCCLAPKNFDLCNKKKLSIENLTIKDKKNFENECSVHWPCKKSYFCEMDWNVECPENWTKTNLQNKENSFLCNPPSSYKGKCNNITIASNFSEYIKRSIASNCDAPWPCIDKKKALHHYPIEDKEISSQNRNTGEENGPITQEGNIYKKKKYTVNDKNDFDFYDIMK